MNATHLNETPNHTIHVILIPLALLVFIIGLGLLTGSLPQSLIPTISAPQGPARTLNGEASESGPAPEAVPMPPADSQIVPQATPEPPKVVTPAQPEPQPIPIPASNAALAGGQS